ncbi:MAG: hypothetical protein D6788_06545, partial [Planctomycetota bacterium]
MLVLVMVLLGILFVTGVALMATMNFESDLIGSDRLRRGKQIGTAAVAAPPEARLRDALLDDPLSTTASAAVEIPGWESLISPVEPYRTVNGTVGCRWVTDTARVFGTDPGAVQYDPRIEIEDTALPNGSQVNVPNVAGGPPTQVRLVDADGDGIVDAVETPLADLRIGGAPIEELARVLNPDTNPEGPITLGLRVIPHGAMVNVNASHPNLVANAMGKICPADNPVTGQLITCQDHLTADVKNDPQLGTFRFRPMLQEGFYDPAQEESWLRRRLLLPPQAIGPTRLGGNPFLDVADHPYGDADLSRILYPPLTVTAQPNPTGYARVFAGEHRFVPFNPLDPRDRLNPNDPQSPSLWEVRMEPITSCMADPNCDPTELDPLTLYDRRHLLTTISYDDLLARSDEDIIRVMREANYAANADNVFCDKVPFEYPNYPFTIPDQTRPGIPDPCDCPTRGEDVCRFDVRKGRLQLSLAWLDEWEARAQTVEAQGNAQAAALMRRRAVRLIYDTFWLLVSNAEGTYWDDACPTGDIDCLAGETCDNSNPNLPTCTDTALGLPARIVRPSRTAASLTANLIDFADADNIPTRIALRSFDLTLPQLAGWEYGDPQKWPTRPRQFVYGVEKQPYITEVATVTDGTQLLGWAVELFNPYDITFSSTGGDDYVIYEVDPNDPDPIASATKVPILVPIQPSGGPGDPPFTVLFTDTTGGNGGVFDPPIQAQGFSGRIHNLANTGTQLSFQSGYVLYLVRERRYPDPDNPNGPPVLARIVLDQFTVNGDVGNPTAPVVNPGAGKQTYTLQRVVRPQQPGVSESPWMGVIPVARQQDPTFGHTLGDWNAQLNDPGLDLRPVEVNTADVGSYRAAFPTTGSLLLLLRHANRSLDDYSITPDLAFNTWLVDTTPVFNPNTGSNFLVREQTQIDNGRMPVFDVGEIDPADPTQRRLFVHHADPSDSDPDKPGRLSTLPWGQLVFDYFTALPLNGPGPYDNPTNDPGFIPGKPDSRPRVDMDGLRVHGRINLNAAPWTVLSGLPFVPMERIPAPFRAKVRWGAGLVDSAAADVLNPNPN